jgi:hypothetical protein
MVIMAALVLSCDKRPFDYRNKFCGTYDFVYIKVPWTVNNGPSPAIEGTYQGKVYYDKKSEKDQILINYNDDETLTFTIDRTGKCQAAEGAANSMEGSQCTSRMRLQVVLAVVVAEELVTKWKELNAKTKYSSLL